MEKRARFESRWLPYALIAPQMAITLVFFFLPASQAIYQSLQVQDAFGISTQFVWFENFQDLFRNDEYLASFRVTAVFSLAVAALGLSISLLLAVLADAQMYCAKARMVRRRSVNLPPPRSAMNPRVPATHPDEAREP